ncbi:MAG TPA: hypothetical protein VF175_09835 [Lacipirellula sp.]
MLRCLMLSGLLAIGSAAAAVAQTQERAWAPFVIPADLPADSQIAFHGKPITVDSPRVVARDGHFFVGDKRLRIWGVNISYGANFPSHEDAQRIARRLEAFGVNSVRFHHMDMEYFRFPESIWDADAPTKLSDEALDRLDYFIDQLAQRGIYANLNLHVSRTHSRHLGLPDSSATGNYDKIVDLFTPELIDAQRDYARQLLTRVNRYRGVAYADDPVIAFVEINNEDSFFMWGAEAKLRKMHPHYAEILRKLFNAWLKERYGTNERLAAAWAPPGSSETEEATDLPVAGDGAAWRLSVFQGAAATPAPKGDSARIDIQKVGTAAWHIEFQQSGLSLRADRQYEVTFRARSDAPRNAVVTVRQGHSPYQTLGLRQTIQLGPAWESFTLAFHPPQNEPDARLSFLLGQSDVALEVADVVLRVQSLIGLAAGERVEDASVAFLIEGASPARRHDRMRFLAETERGYYAGFRRFIREELGCDALVTGTMAYGFLGLWSQQDMDYIDTHTYWAHPQFPAGWSETNWTIDQKSFVDHYTESKLFHDAATRLPGKPFTVSEFSHPAPNDYQAEGVPVVATMAAAQDWDGVWLFGYSHKNDWDADAFDGFFSFHANPSKWGYMPLGAAIFREGGIEPLPIGYSWPLTHSSTDPLDELIDLHLTHDLAMMNGLLDRWGLDRSAALRQRIAVTLDGEPAPLPTYAGSTTMIDLQAGRLRAEGRGALVRIESGGSGGLARDDGFAVLAAAAVDGRLLAESSDVLIALVGRCENTGMGFSSDRRTIGNHWGTGPVRIEAIAADLCWPWAKGMRLTALSPDGRPAGQAVIETSDQCPALLRLSPRHKTMWYQLTRDAPVARNHGE